MCLSIFSVKAGAGRENDAKELPIPYKVYLLIGFVTLLVVVTIAYSLFTANRMAAKYAPLVDAAMEIKLEASTSHLWFEEVITGDRSVDITEVWRHLDEADWYAQAMLKGGKSIEGTFIALKDPQLRAQVEQVRQKIKQFREIGEQRYAMQNGGKTGSQLDQKFDTVFADLIRVADDVETRVQLVVMARDLNVFKTIQFGLIVTCLILAMIIAVVIHRFDRQRSLDFLEIQDAKLLAQQNEKWLSTTMESMGDAVIITDPEGIVTYLNPVATFLTGWKPYYAKGKFIRNIFNIINSETGKPAENPVNRIIREKKVIGLANHTVLISKDGEKYPIDDSGAPIVDDQGNLLGVVMIFRDITEKTKAEKKQKQLLKTLEVKNKELKSIVYAASHDLKTPLINIKGFSDELASSCTTLEKLLQENAVEDTLKHEIETLINEDIPQSISFIQLGADKMQMLLDGLLQVSRAGTIEVEVEQLDMNRVIDNIIGSIKFQIEKNKASVVCDNLPPCQGDATQIGQIFSNLIDNAIKYIDETRKPKVHVTGQIKDKMAIYTVADNGLGIAPDYKEKIFEIFHRLDPAGQVTGEGLGLTIVSRILDRHNGSIRVESELGKGSKFVVTLPTV
ncbi:MAG: PAS domain S-box protein [Planctomycetes bacterium]|nr:PAS domain S-box protein [Planctomycetota bacterium]